MRALDGEPLTAASAPSSSAPEELRDALRRLEEWGTARQWAGTDPYDGLNATRFSGPLRRTALGRRVLTQLVKRSPINLRPLLGIPPEPSAAALAHVSSSYALGDYLDDELTLSRLTATLEALMRMRLEAGSGHCWGYPFDVQTRVFFYPRGAPNTIATSFAGGALLDAYERTGDERWLDAAVEAADFFVDQVPQTAANGHGAFFGYLVGDRTPIHNANLLVCALLARVAAHAGRPDLASRAQAGVEYTVSRQRPDGSWPYGEQPGLEWVDNFHTGYVLESLLRCRDAGLDVDVRALDDGLRLYREALFLADGAPRYSTTSLYPIDAQSVAQGIQTFALASASHPEYAQTAWRVFEFALRRMLRSDGAFIFQRRRIWTTRTPHVRWCEAPMLHALTHLARASAGGS